MSKRSAPLSKADLLKVQTTQIDVGDSFVTIRALSASYGYSFRGKELHTIDIFGILAESIVEENGAPMLTAEEVGQIAIATLEKIVKGIFIFNELGTKAVDDAINELKKTDDLTTNSAPS